MTTKEKILVIGIGNSYRRDDGVGPWIVARLQAEKNGIRAVSSTGEVTELLELLQEGTEVVVVDAIQTGGLPGRRRRFEAQEAALPAEWSNVSSHGIGLPEAIELARALGQLPKRITVYGIEGKDFSHGTGLSPEVEVAAEELAREIALGTSFDRSKGL